MVDYFLQEIILFRKKENFCFVRFYSKKALPFTFFFIQKNWKADDDYCVLEIL
jgi:hypothetical protein